ncbi:MAG TPA: L,D-transpeptidase family protein [Firmicutes bacterium]|nr:L,D-transpeptidase family protein [Bacillota bacterium]
MVMALCLTLSGHSAFAQSQEPTQARGGLESPGLVDFDDDPGPKIIINIPAYRLYFYRDNRLVKDYPIAVGKSVSRTILGEYTIVRKAKNPTWYPPDGSPPVPPGPANPVGSRWLGLSKDGYGIHGTNNPSSIGKAVSLGCIRMLEKDVQELYEMAPIGTRVKFIYETVIVTTDPVLGQVYITAFPDIYNMGTNSISHAVSTISKSPGAAGLEPDQFMLSHILSEARGQPVIFPRRVEIVLGGKTLKNDGFLQAGEPMLPLADLATAMATAAPGATTIHGRVYIPLSACKSLPGLAGAGIRLEYRGLMPVVYIDLPEPILAKETAPVPGPTGGDTAAAGDRDTPGRGSPGEDPAPQ